MQIEKDNNVDLTGVTQHGFKKKKSTITAAIHLQTKIPETCDQKKYVAVASLDLSSAFDVIDVINVKQNNGEPGNSMLKSNKRKIKTNRLLFYTVK